VAQVGCQDSSVHLVHFKLDGCVEKLLGRCLASVRRVCVLGCW
jgi:hypothetical protein